MFLIFWRSLVPEIAMRRCWYIQRCLPKLGERYQGKGGQGGSWDSPSIAPQGLYQASVLCTLYQATVVCTLYQAPVLCILFSVPCSCTLYSVLCTRLLYSVFCTLYQAPSNLDCGFLEPCFQAPNIMQLLAGRMGSGWDWSKVILLLPLFRKVGFSSYVQWKPNWSRWSDPVVSNELV